ncbi:MAG: 4-phosphopantoate--beta-alanine ligase [Nitrosopumilus sp.]|uniref:4-phosphopantoate--beta-alanine ligase n=1 Tax=Nitrosopumilus sp. TaxID=2024843 RepID=UPI002470360E|nr:4-phosphopantoate--beta-alanine ligase [Nitrosopumilus sp.]MDH5430833.1 4-phosphopantoate--beta-alanine ligase [Nitrosopumilus sp.]MDH5665314.1 4-phosphopantoate--beta-alanine ligase [Nitrosopumilus sp.]
MSLIPKSHPRAKSLLIREKLVDGFDNGLVAKEGLLAQGRGEAFDYLLGEKTGKDALQAIRAAAAQLLIAKMPVISVNGNIAALCPKEIVRLSKQVKAKLEVNLFYTNEKRKQAIIKTLKKNGAKEVLGSKITSSKKLPGIDSARRIVDKDGIFVADVVVVPLEDGDRTMALRKAGKTVITFDLNPLSRTSETANITIVDNVTRAIDLLIAESKKLSKENQKTLLKIIKNFDNKKNLRNNVIQIKNNLSRRAKIA